MTFDAELEPTVVEGVPDRLGRAVDNLLDNAAKYAPEGSVVEVVLRDGELTVRDHGPGIPAADRPHVFDRFYRGATRARAARLGPRPGDRAPGRRDARRHDRRRGGARAAGALFRLRAGVRRGHRGRRRRAAEAPAGAERRGARRLLGTPSPRRDARAAAQLAARRER